MELNVPVHVIGVVRSAHDDPDNTPIQAGVNRAEQGVIDVRHQVFGHPGLFVCDGSMIPANLAPRERREYARSGPVRAW